MTSQPRKSLADKVIELIAGDTSTEEPAQQNAQPEVITIETPKEELSSNSKVSTPVKTTTSEPTDVNQSMLTSAVEKETMSNSSLVKEHTSTSSLLKDKIVSPKKRKPGNISTNSPKANITNKTGVSEPLKEEAEDKKSSMAEAKEKVQAQVSDVLQKQKSGEIGPLHPNSKIASKLPEDKDLEPTKKSPAGSIETNTSPVVTTNSSRTSIPESPLKKHLVETEDMAREEQTGSQPHISSIVSGAAATGVAIGVATAVTGLKGTPTTSNENEDTASMLQESSTAMAKKNTTTSSENPIILSKENMGKNSNGSNPSLRDSSILNGGVVSPVAIHSGAMYKKGKYLPCLWKRRHFQLFSTGDFKWYMPGNSATVKGTISGVNSSSESVNHPEMKVYVTRGDGVKVLLHILELKVLSGSPKKTILIGMESEQELITFIEKTKQISPSST